MNNDNSFLLEFLIKDCEDKLFPWEFDQWNVIRKKKRNKKQVNQIYLEKKLMKKQMFERSTNKRKQLSPKKTY